MCLPALPMIAMGLSLAGSGLNFAQQSAYASGMNRYQQQISERNQKIAHEAAKEQYGALGARLVQESVRTGQETIKIRQEGLEARGRVTTAAAEAGVGGGSVSELLRDFGRQEGEFVDALTASEGFFKTQAEFEKRGIRLGLESRLINSIPDKIQRPNLLGSALSAFTDVFDIYSNYNYISSRYGGGLGIP